ncbi:MAG: LytTR family DNA-binding domain-containing protein [Eubacteriales bacterium]|nr:LytTR family DNA-binding domain-containing protein [Eubacteriales bacterium]
MFHIGICDDCREIGGELEEMLYSYGEKHGIQMDVSIWYTGENLCGYLKNSEQILDVLFLDIELNTTDGVQIGRFIREEMDNLDTMIIYISGNSSHAMDLFRIQPLEFLIKPLDAGKVQEVMDRVIRLTEKKKGIFEYYSGGFYFKVLVKDILYLHSQNKKIHIILKDGNKEFNGKLKDVIPDMPGSFIQIHQSYVINFDHIDECSYDTVKMKNGDILSISQPYRKQVREQMAKRMWRKRGEYV